MSDMPPLGSLCSARRASSALASTSTMALPIAVTSNLALFITAVLSRGQTPSQFCLGRLQILGDQRCQLLPDLWRDRIGPSDEGVLERRRTFAGSLVRQGFDGGGDDVLRGLGVVHQIGDDHLPGHLG